MRHLTIRNIPPEVAEALEGRRARSRASLNQTVIDLLRRALGVRGQGKERDRRVSEVCRMKLSQVNKAAARDRTNS